MLVKITALLEQKIKQHRKVLDETMEDIELIKKSKLSSGKVVTELLDKNNQGFFHQGAISALVDLRDIISDVIEKVSDKNN